VAAISSAEILGDTRHGTDRGAGVCVGRPVPSISLELIRVTDEELRTGTTACVCHGDGGEIVVRGPQVTTAYHNAPRHDRLAKIRDHDGGIGTGWAISASSTRRAGSGSSDARPTGWRLRPGRSDTIPCEGVFQRPPGGAPQRAGRRRHRRRDGAGADSRARARGAAPRPGEDRPRTARDRRPPRAQPPASAASLPPVVPGRRPPQREDRAGKARPLGCQKGEKVRRREGRGPS